MNNSPIKKRGCWYSFWNPPEPEHPSIINVLPKANSSTNVSLKFVDADWETISFSSSASSPGRSFGERDESAPLLFPQVSEEIKKDPYKTFDELTCCEHTVECLKFIFC